MCMFPTLSMAGGSPLKHLVDILNAATGWDYTEQESTQHGQRLAQLMRVFNLRHGVGPEVEAPSIRYSSAPVDGPVQGKSILPHWDQMLDEYYRIMGWDRKTGRPLPETLRAVGLEKLIPDIW